MKKIGYIIILFSSITFSCTNKFGSTFEVENKTNSNIDSLFISNGFNNVNLNKINKNEKVILFLDFKKNNPKSDGNFLIKYKLNNKHRNKMFGYFSNGIPSNKNVKVQIYEDTIIINEIY
jgi:hypothetical protein